MSKITKRIITTSAVVLAIILLTIFMVNRTSAKTRENSISHMNSIAQEQTVMLRNYIENAKRTLEAFGTGSEVKTLLREVKEKDVLKGDRSYKPEDLLALMQENLETLNDAQAYTERFSATVDEPEGIWIGDWYTHVLTHTYKGPIGRTTRDPIEKAEALQALRDGMMNSSDPNHNKLYVYGVMRSPASDPGDHPFDAQVLSMYQAVMDGDEPIGFVGFGIHTRKLAEQFSNLDLNTENTTYSMVKIENLTYIFDADRDKIDQPVEDENMVKICERYAGETSNVTGNYESDGNITFYSYMADTGWVLFITSPSSEVFAFSKSINFNMIAFCLVCIVLIIIFNIISIKQDETLERLEQSRKKQAAITKNLHTAALKDILTDVNNRNKFIDDFSKNENGAFKIADCPDTPYCFAMFNIANFSRINITNGHDVGDLVLTTTADILKKHFGPDNVYRTGSDEFVVVFKSPVSTVSAFLKDINLTLAELKSPRSIGNGSLVIPYAASAVKKGTEISSSVLITLKDLINLNGITKDGNIVFVDMDNAQ